VLAGGALVAATVLALLAHAVLSVAGARGSSRSHTLLTPLATHLVGARNTSNAQVAVKDLLDTRGGAGSLLRRHAESKTILTKLAASGPPSERSWAANVLGAVAFQDASLDRANATAYLREALGAFRQAIRSDTTNEDPKFNLELLLTLDKVGRAAQRASTQPQKRTAKPANARHRESGYGY
jgi:hypothetical protein